MRGSPGVAGTVGRGKKTSVRKPLPIPFRTLSGRPVQLASVPYCPLWGAGSECGALLFSSLWGDGDLGLFRLVFRFFFDCLPCPPGFLLCAPRALGPPFLTLGLSGVSVPLSLGRLCVQFSGSLSWVAFRLLSDALACASSIVWSSVASSMAA